MSLHSNIIHFSHWIDYDFKYVQAHTILRVILVININTLECQINWALIKRGFVNLSRPHFIRSV